ncbi:MAG: efflux transporter periplasmic adaptor subunit [Rhizobiaceae bacterium]|jgi:RND family efflux transporter MFP subunit|nr:efflux transporter periplasmic adaptor subunit [Rhizobiaceae bacterium]
MRLLTPKAAVLRLVLLAAVLAGLASAGAAAPACAGKLTLEPTDIVEWKAVYGRVEPRDLAPARARLGGTLVELDVAEGDLVKAGQRIAVVRDEKLVFQVAALDAQLRALNAQLDRAQTELDRGQALVDRGVVTAQRLEQLRTDVEVARSQIGAAEAQREVIVQQQAEGDVFAPADGRVLTVPVTRDAVVMAGETVANIGSGGFYLRLAIPERHAGQLEENSSIRVTAGGEESVGKLVKVYPQIENGRVIADVEVENLKTAFVDARILVEVPVGRRPALLVPGNAVTVRSGIDFVTVAVGGAEVERSVVIGEAMEGDGGTFIEVISGLSAGDVVVTP